jgi:hypothetical protein
MEIRKSRDFGEIISATFEFLRIHFKSISLSLLFYAGPFSFIGGVGYGMMNGKLFDYSLLTEGSISSIINLVIFGSIFYVFLLLATMMSILIVNTYIDLVEKSESKAPIPHNEVWNIAKERIGVTIVTSIASFLMIAVGSLFCIIPGIWFLMPLSMIYILRFQEPNLGLVDAIKRSFFIIKDNWWMTFGVYIVIAMIVGIMAQIFSLPTFVMTLVTGLTMTSDPSGSYSIVMTILNVFFGIVYTVGTLLLSSITYIAMGFQYFSLVEQKDPVSLLKKIEAIGNRSSSKDDSDETY